MLWARARRRAFAHPTSPRLLLTPPRGATTAKRCGENRARRSSDRTTCMFQDNPEWTEYQRRRWTRPNAKLYLRPDPKLYLQPNQKLYFKPQPYERKEHPDPSAELDELLRLRSELESLKAEIKFRRLLHARKYSPDQPRVPAGNPDGGRWTSGEGTSASRNDPRVISDAVPDGVKPGAR